MIKTQMINSKGKAAVHSKGSCSKDGYDLSTFNRNGRHLSRDSGKWPALWNILVREVWS